MNLLRKIYAADEIRKSRLHDMQGHLVPFSELRVIPLRLIENIQSKFGRYSDEPWWPPQAAARIKKILDRNSTAVEFGSGISTLWLARRVGRIIAVENNQAWRQRGVDALVDQGLTKATIIFRTGDRYLDVGDDAPSKIDLASWTACDALIG
jgi:hypothetical protein